MMKPIWDVLITVFVLGIVGMMVYLFLRFIYIFLVEDLHVYRWIALIFVIIIVPIFIYYISSKLEFGCGLPRSGFRHPSSIEPRIVGLVKSKMASNIPDTMEVGTFATASARIVQSLDTSILLKNIPDSEERQFIIDTLNITSRVKATLIDPADGENFKIQALNSEEQVVDKRSVRTWKWRVMPIKGGKQKELDLRVSIMVRDDFGRGFEDIPVFEKKVFVKTTFVKSITKFISDNWQWLTGAIFLPLFLWGRTIFLNKKNKRSGAANTVKGFFNKN